MLVIVADIGVVEGFIKVSLERRGDLPSSPEIDCVFRVGLPIIEALPRT
jgi:hypothetical protein